MHNYKSFTLFLIRQAGHSKDLFVLVGQVIESFLDIAVRNHLSSDLAKPAQSSLDPQISFLIDPNNVACIIPTIPEHFPGLFRHAEIAHHHVRPLDLQQARFTGRLLFSGVGIYDFCFQIAQQSPDRTRLIRALFVHSNSG